MYNEIFSIGPITIHGYGLMIGIGVLFALTAGIWLAKKIEIDPEELYNLSFISVLGGFLCAKVLYCIIEWERFIKDPLKIGRASCRERVSSPV